MSKRVQPVVKHQAFWVESQNLKKQKRRRKKQRNKVSSVKLGRNNDEGNLSKEHHDQDDEGFDATVTPDFERKKEKDASDIKSGDTKEELDLERIQSTARQSAVTPRTLNFDDEEQFKDDEFLADIPLNI
ncbi:hypothetical protein Tco_0325587, partial [Tanacetum coccineum]